MGQLVRDGGQIGSLGKQQVWYRSPVMQADELRDHNPPNGSVWIGEAFQQGPPRTEDAVDFCIVA